MKNISRILAVCNDFEKCDLLLKKCAKISEEHDCGVTLMFVKEEELFELPFFSDDDVSDHKKLRKELLKKAKNKGIDNLAVLIYENDTADRAALEAEKENDSLIIMPYTEKITDKVIRKCNVPTLILKDTVPEYARAVVVVDTIVTGKCMDFLHTLFSGTEISLLQDFSYFPMPVSDTGVDPFGIGTDGIDYLEFLKSQKKAFYEFRQENGVNGAFIVGENSIEDNIVSFVKQKQADLLSINVAQRGTILADAIDEIILKSSGDVFVCFENSL